MNNMQQNNPQAKQSSKPKPPFLLKFSTQQKPRRIMSLNRLNYPQNLQKDGTFVAKKDIIEHELFDHHIVQNNMKIQGELRKLQIAYIHEKVPQFYVYYFMNRLAVASEQKIEDKINKQLEEVKTKRSFFHVISNAIKAREGCLKQLHRCLENLFDNQEDNVTKHVFREEITHYRKLTGFVISHIRAWKQSLNDISPQIDFTTFLYHAEDYLIKLLNDCEFIFNSFLSRHLKFSYRNDPYIMRPYVDGRQSKYLDLFKFQEDQKANYMIDLNYLAGERAKYLESKMNSKNEKIKQIQRIYHYKDVPLTSRIIVRKLPSGKADRKDDKEDKHEVEIDNFMSANENNSEKKVKLAEISKKTQKIKQIKQIFGKTSQSHNRIINENMFQTIGGESKKFITPYEEKLKYTQYHQNKAIFANANFQSDFENLLRKKELEVLKAGSTMDATKTQRSFKNIKIRDNLSESKKFITNEEGFSELQKILNQLDTFSPQKLDNYKLKKKQDLSNSTLMKFNEGKPAKSKKLEPQKTLLEHNEEVYVNVRNKVIEEIEKGMQEKVLFEEKRKQQNEQIQSILQKKINQESLNIIKNSRAKNVQGREHLAKEMQGSRLFGYEQKKTQNSEKLSYLQEELRKEMQLKWLRQVQEQLKRKTEYSQLEKIKNKQDKQLNKQIEKIKQKQQLQKRYQQIERQQKAKAMQKQIELDEQRKKQIEEEMRIVIQRQKQEMEKFAAIQRSEVEQQLKDAMKARMLEEIKNQNERFYDNTKKQEQKVKKQEEYREQVRNKIQEEYKVGQQMKKNRERQQKLAKIRLVKEKLGQFDSPSKKAGDKSLIKNEEKIKVEQLDEKSLKSRITQFPDFRESLFPKYQKNSELEKKKLRQQFQLELFAFRKPENNEQNEKNQGSAVYEQGTIPIKDFRTMIDKEMVQFQAKQAEEKQNQANVDQEIKLIRPEQFVNQQIESQMNKTVKSQPNSDKFTKFSRQNQESKEKQKNQQDELIRMKLGMTFEEYSIYKKKKNALTLKRDVEGQGVRKKMQQDKKAVIKVIDSFEKMDNLLAKPKEQKGQSQNFRQLSEAFPDNLSSNNQVKKQAFGTIKQQDIEDADDNKVKIDRHKKNDSKFGLEKNIKNTPIEQPRDIQILTVNSKITSFAGRRFQTSGSEEQKQKKVNRKNKKVSKKKNNKNESIDSPKQGKKLQRKQSKKQEQIAISKPMVTTIKKRQIPVGSLGDFFKDHFEHLPKVIKKINIYKKEELIKFLLEHSSFTILEFIKQNTSIGLGIVLYNENKNKYRSLNIVHLGSYDEGDYLEVLIQVVRHCFKNDPCQQITMSNIYDRQISEQWEFVKKFEKQFDPYGAIFQKKIFNTQFERKLVLRRNIGEVCKVEPVKQFNRGHVQLHVNAFITESQDEEIATEIVEADQYQEINYNVGYYGILAHYLSERYSEETLAYLISKSTEKNSTAQEKTVASLAKLSLAMRKNQSFQRLVELTEQKFNNIMNLNLELLSKQQAVVAYPPEAIQRPLQCTWMSYKVGIQLSYDFYSQTIPIKINESKDEEGDQYLCKYLRYTPNKKNKMFTLKSSAYSAKITVLPCRQNKYKMFVLDSEEYEGILQKSDGDENRLDLGVYLRVFFANLIEHEVADYDHIWLPQINIIQNKNQIPHLENYSAAEVSSNKLMEKGSEKSFAGGVIRSSLNFTYSDYLGSSLVVQPSHRDLVVTPPFIMGILNMQIETAQEGSPVFVQRIGKSQMSWLKEVLKAKVESD